MNEAKTLTTREVAQKLRYSEDTVREMCEDGTFPNAYRRGPGAQWRVPESDIDAFRKSTRPFVRGARKQS